MTATIVRFRNDLRIDDHPALLAAIQRSQPVVPVFVWSPDEAGNWAPGAAARWWLDRSLRSLAADLQRRGSQLIIRSGDVHEEIAKLVEETTADALYWSRDYEPALLKSDQRLETSFTERGVEAVSYSGRLLFEPDAVRTKQGNPYRVFTPFWKACLNLDPPREPISAPRKIPAPQDWPETESIDSLGLAPPLDWADQFSKRWQPGEQGANKKLKRFLKEAVADYETGRDQPDDYGTSRMSPHLHFGEISPHKIWYALQTQASDGSQAYLRELGWREFAYHVLVNFPETPDQPLRPQFQNFPWKHNAKALRKWQRGQTGYPIVDAGMRELWTTGWMHNRVRMIVASFLTKDLLIDWRQGARWFWDTLVDADLANNTMGWQWTAGSGADAAPYFRIFNPVRQGEKFDPAGDYVRQWVPELKSLPKKWIHNPWEAPTDVLADAGVELGEDYPQPIVDHGEARKAALAAYEEIKAT
ncbi:Deoxyribodipyrimidine photo-lyase [Symmachiella dynata]|uniref:cryptochrome/photolyase family protein n=1 Tax=Symmachiella dynata TaxID=2527995 RepID=UPI001189ED62|nr:deoxyribodipyrimidine photo-lyase [Symmachiella dynata]QDT51298.1 Deoxyribodipyrimidine photo-lyase [Symmachiella dynata]